MKSIALTSASLTSLGKQHRSTEMMVRCILALEVIGTPGAGQQVLEKAFPSATTSFSLDAGVWVLLMMPTCPYRTKTEKPHKSLGMTEPCIPVLEVIGACGGKP